MNLLTNLQVINQTRFDSGSLSGLAAVVHRFTQPGEHRVIILREEQPVHTLSLRVLPGAAQPSAGPAMAAGPQAAPAALPTQVHVDLGRALTSPGRLAPVPQEAPQVAAGGYALFHAPSGPGGIAVQVHAPGAKDQAPLFDSRRMQNGDIFTVTLLRPGRYSLLNAPTGAKGEIRVSYPVVGDTPYRPPEPVEVRCGAQGFQPDAIRLKPAQGLIFHIGDTSARIQIELVEPDDGPATGIKAQPGQRRPLARWQKPEPPQR